MLASFFILGFGVGFVLAVIIGFFISTRGSKSYWGPFCEWLKCENCNYIQSNIFKICEECGSTRLKKTIARRKIESYGPLSVEGRTIEWEEKA